MIFSHTQTQMQLTYTSARLVVGGVGAAENQDKQQLLCSCAWHARHRKHRAALKCHLAMQMRANLGPQHMEGMLQAQES